MKARAMAGKNDKTSEKSASRLKSARTPAARRALEEAERRRKAARNEEKTRQKEVDGRDGPDPARYGDWEKDGIISDF